MSWADPTQVVSHLFSSHSVRARPGSVRGWRASLGTVCRPRPAVSGALGLPKVTRHVPPKPEEWVLLNVGSPVILKMVIFFVEQPFAHNSTYSNVHPPAHTTPDRTIQNHTTPRTKLHTPCTRNTPHTQHTVPQPHSVTRARHNTITHSRTRPTLFKVARGLQRKAYKLGIGQGPCTLALVALRCRWVAVRYWC